MLVHEKNRHANLKSEQIMQTKKQQKSQNRDAKLLISLIFWAHVQL